MANNGEKYSCDAAGYPIDPAHPWNVAPVTWHAGRVDTFAARKLRQLETAWRAGRNVRVLMTAWRLCRESGNEIPAWLVDAADSVMNDDRTYLKGRRGRLAQDDTLERKAAVHFARHDAVRELRDRREELAVIGYKPTWKAAYVNAAAMLRDVDPKATPDTVQSSYRKVERLLKSERAARFYRR